MRIFALPSRVRARSRRCMLEIFDVEIVLPHETDHPSVRTKLFADFLFRIARQTNRAIAAKLVIEKIVGPVDQDSGFSGIEIDSCLDSPVVARSRADARQSSKCSLHFRSVEKRHGFTRRCIDLLQPRHVASRRFVGN